MPFLNAHSWQDGVGELSLGFGSLWPALSMQVSQQHWLSGLVCVMDQQQGGKGDGTFHKSLQTRR